MPNIFGYGYVKNNKLSTDIYSDDYKKTRVYMQLRNMFIHEDDIYVDIITSSYNNQDKFWYLMQKMKAGDTIVLPKIDMLAEKRKDVIMRYEMLYNNRIGVLVPDYSQPNGVAEISTTDYSFKEVDASPEDFEAKKKLISELQIKKGSGLAKSEITAEFKVVYWLYEHFYISENDACHNSLFDMSKVKFHGLATDYESSLAYAEDELQQVSNIHLFVDKMMDEVTDNEKKEILKRLSNYLQKKWSNTDTGIAEKPKRNSTVPPNFEAVRNCMINSDVELSDACSKFNCRLMSNITFARYLVKQDGGKRILVLSSNRCRDLYITDIIS